MTFGFPAHFSGSYLIKAGAAADFPVIVKQALDALSWTITGQSADHIDATVGFNMSSWGEKISISLMSDNAIYITSKCAWQTQCIDWGKNKANVEKFLAKMKTLAG